MKDEIKKEEGESSFLSARIDFNEEASYLFQFSSHGKKLVTVDNDGTVVIHSHGAEKEAAEIFWNAFGDMIKQRWIKFQNTDD